MAVEYGVGYAPAGSGGDVNLTNYALETGGNLAGVLTALQAPLTTKPPVASVANRSGTITTGGTAQVLCSANPTRRGLVLQNNSTGDLWINRNGGTAILGQPSLCIPSGSYYETPVGGNTLEAVSIIGATTGQEFTAEEY